MKEAFKRDGKIIKNVDIYTYYKISMQCININTMMICDKIKSNTNKI